MKKRLLLQGAFAALVSSAPLSGATNTWTGATNGTWDVGTTANWASPTTWANGNDAVFNASGINQSITVGAGVEVLKGAGDFAIQVTGGAGSNYTFSGGPIVFQAAGGDTIIRTSGSGTAATFNSLLDYTAGASGQFRVDAQGGTLTLNGGINAGPKQIQMGFFGGGIINITGGAYTSGTWTAAQGTTNITGNTTITASGGYAGFNGKTTFNSATASASFAGNADNSTIGQSGNTSEVEIQNGNVTYTGGLSVMNANGAATTNTGTLDVQGGRLTVGGQGINLVRNNNNLVGQGGSAAFTVSGGVVTTTGVNFGRGTVSAGNSATLALSGGQLYIGAQGITKNVAFTSLSTSIDLSGGTLGASADWSSSLAITVSGPVTIKAADEANAAHDISLSGILSGGGSITKTGDGILTLSGTNAYTGGTTASSGELIAAAAGSLGTGNVTVGLATLTLQSSDVIADTAALYFQSGSTINLDFGGEDILAAVVNTDTLASIGAGTYTFTELNDFFGGSVFSGTGSLTVIPEPSSWLLGVSSLGAFCLFRRRKAA